VSGAQRQALLIAAAISAVVVIAALSLSPDTPALVYLGKPLTTLLLLVLAAGTRDALAPSYRALVTAGLLASLVGDVFLMLPGDYFLAGLASFLVAHLLYIVAFSTRARFLRHQLPVLAYVVVATLVLFLVLPTVGGVLRTAIVAYVLVITVMAAQGTCWLIESPAAPSARLVALGAACFVSSDALLALDRFVTYVPARDLLILGSYWLGQGCIAASVRRAPPPTLRMS
jgi:uncharacterized membrane protein YhhN